MKGKAFRRMPRGLTVLVLLLLTPGPSILAQPQPPTPMPAAKYYSVETVALEDGMSIDRVVINGPPTPPPGFEAERATVPEHVAASTALPVPAYDWSYGCAATSAAMIAAYYDRTGYANIYTGPTNGGVMPMDNATWGNTTWPRCDQPGTVSVAECPLSATHQGVDGRATRGHVDDYWVGYKCSGPTHPDPWVGNWAEHALGDCTGDYMETNKWYPSYGFNEDGATTFSYRSDGSKCYATDLEASGPPLSYDGGVGIKQFYESRGYVVTNAYNQYIKGQGSNPNLGYTYDQYKVEIDAGRPVMIHVEGHTMVGIGYDDSSSDLMYINDTWDHSTHAMTWGGSYSGMQHLGVTIVQVEHPTPQPLVTEVTYDSSVGAGDYSEIFLRVLNAGDASDEGGISISFPDFSGSNDDQYVQFIHTSPDCEYDAYPQGDTIHDRDGVPFPASYLLVESVDTNWQNNEENTLTIRVYPQEEGAFQFYVRSAMGYQGQFVNDPSSSTYVDQQGWEVYRYVINVGNSPPYTPHSPSPPDGATDQPLDTTLSWSGGDPDGHSVTYYVRLEPGDEWPDDIVCTTSNTTCDPGPLAHYNEYFWRVTAVDQYGGETEGPVWSFTAEPGPGPNPPSGLATSVTCQPSIELNWTDNTDEESSYHIERSVNSPSDWDPLVIVPRNTEAYSDLDVECGNTYYYRVRAYRTNPDQYSTYSNVAQTDACPSSLGSFSGHVRDEDLAPIAGASVVIMSGPTACSQSTGPSGHYQMINLQPGIYSARAQKPGYLSADRAGIAVLAGQDTTSQDFVLSPLSGPGVIWGDETRLTMADYESRTPDIAVDSLGHVHVVWHDARPDDRGNDIFYKWYDGESWSPDIRLTPETSPSDPTCDDARITADLSGNVHIVWIDTRGDEDEIYYSKLDGFGNILVDQKRITADDGEQEQWADIVADSNGHLHLVWRHNNESINRNEIHYIKLDGNGNPLISEKVISSSPTEWANFPKIALDSDDYVHIVYDKSISGYDPHEVYYTKLDNNGNVLVGNMETSSHDGLDSKTSYLTVDSDDRVHTFWKDERNGWTVYWSLLGNSGSTLVDDTELGQTIEGYLFPAAAVGGTGSVYLVWQDDSDGNHEIYFNLSDEDGWAEQGRITHDPASSFNPEIASDNGNTFYIVWTDTRDGNEEIYFIQGTECLTILVPALLSPADGLRTGDGKPTFTWESVGPDVSYHLQVANDESFASSVIDVELAGTTYTPATSISPGSYHWRVRASTPCGMGEWSAPWEITVVGEPSAPVLISPPNTSWTCDATPIFQWDAVPDAVSYRLQLDDDELFDAPAADESVSGTSFTPGTALAYDTYYWRVRTTNDFDMTGPWSDRWTVRVLGSPGSPALSSPSSGAVLDDRTPTLAWSAPADAASYAVQVDDTPGFLSPVVDESGLTVTSYTPGELPEGAYFWRVRAAGPCGSSGWSATWSFTIDDLQGPAISTPTFAPFADCDEPLIVTAWIGDATTGNNGVGQASLCYGYSYPYAEDCTPGVRPLGNGDGLWSFTIPPQGSVHLGQELHFSLIARDGDDSPTSTNDTNNGEYYRVAVVEVRRIYLPVILRQR